MRGQFSRANIIGWQVAQESYDVLIVGGGLAGIRAAIAAAEANPRLRIGMVSKVYPMRSHTVSAEGGAAAAIAANDSYETHAFDTVKGSDYLADQDVVEAFVREKERWIRRRVDEARQARPRLAWRVATSLCPWAPTRKNWS